MIIKNTPQSPFIQSTKAPDDAAKVVLEDFQIQLISGGDRCTFSESSDFFSYRRDGVNSGRMAHLIWMT